MPETAPNRIATLAVAAAAAVYTLISAAMLARLPAATAAWPWPEPGISFVFLGSIAAAVAAPLAWIAITGELAALAPLALNALVVHASTVAFLGARMGAGEQGLAVSTALTAAHAVVAALVLAWSRNLSVRDPRRTPPVVRFAFAVFTLVLVAVGIALVLRSPRIFPWNLGPQTSTIFGLLFLGAATYFAYGIARPLWAFAAGQLWGFVAYDVILLVPYARMLGDGGPGASDGYGSDPVNGTSLAIYLSVLIASALLALAMFFVDGRTRITARRVASA